MGVSRYRSILISAFLFFLVLMTAPGVLRAQSDTWMLEKPSWVCGDWWVLEQTKKDIASPTPYWKEPVRWRCEVKKSQEGSSLLVLEIRSLSGLETGVDIVFSESPWEIKTIKKLLVTKDGLKTFEQKINSSGPVMALDSPFSLVLPRFPLESITVSKVTGSGGMVTNSEGSAASNVLDPKGVRQVSPIQYDFTQKVYLPDVDDPIRLRGETAMSSIKGEIPGGLGDATVKVELTRGRTKAEQMWSQTIPWALVEETPHSRTAFIENHKGMMP